MTNETRPATASGPAEEITGIVHTAAGHGRRYRIGYEDGEIFEDGADYSGITLTVEATSMGDAEWALVGLFHGRHLPRGRCDVLMERWRQAFYEGFDAAHDDQWSLGELGAAAICYISGKPDCWPWAMHWWKPKDRRRNLVRAAALIIAEIERIDRSET